MEHKQKISLEVAGQNFDFEVRHSVYNKFVDGANGGSITQASFNFASKSVSKDKQQELIAAFEEFPGLDIVVANALADEYSKPDLSKMVKPARKSQKKS